MQSQSEALSGRHVPTAGQATVVASGALRVGARLGSWTLRLSKAARDFWAQTLEKIRSLHHRRQRAGRASVATKPVFQSNLSRVS